MLIKTDIGHLCGMFDITTGELASLLGVNKGDLVAPLDLPPALYLRISRLSEAGTLLAKHELSSPIMLRRVIRNGEGFLKRVKAGDDPIELANRLIEIIARERLEEIMLNRIQSHRNSRATKQKSRNQ